MTSIPLKTLRINLLNSLLPLMGITVYSPKQMSQGTGFLTEEYHTNSFAKLCRCHKANHLCGLGQVLDTKPIYLRSSFVQSKKTSHEGHAEKCEEERTVGHTGSLYSLCWCWSQGRAAGWLLGGGGGGGAVSREGGGGTPETGNLAYTAKTDRFHSLKFGSHTTVSTAVYT